MENQKVFVILDSKRKILGVRSSLQAAQISCNETFSSYGWCNFYETYGKNWRVDPPEDSPDGNSLTIEVHDVLAVGDHL